MVLTNDLDFAAILAASHPKKPSVAQIRAEDLSPSAFGAQAVATLRQVQPESEAGALLTIEADRTRLRVLPFRSDVTAAARDDFPRALVRFLPL